MASAILLVDDEPNITNALRREIQDWADEHQLEIITANSAILGLSILEQRGQNVVLIVSDLKMPEMKGSDFLLEVKMKYPHIISILLTGYSEQKEVGKAVSAGIFSYILKPWEPDYLLAELQKAWEHGDMQRQNASYLKLVEEELRWAGEMQRAILKPNIPSSDGVEFRVSYRPVPGLYCGGDYYDVILIGPDRYLLIVGDVAGHGVKAAFITGILKAVIYPEFVRGYINKDFSPGAFLSWLNDRLNFEFRSASTMMVTMFAGVLDVSNGFFRYANAGQDHPFLMRGPKLIELDVQGTGLGMVKSVLYTEHSQRILLGDQLVLYTDGLAQVGYENAQKVIPIPELLSSVEIGDDYHRRLLGAALKMAAQKDFTDDVTILTARLV